MVVKNTRGYKMVGSRQSVIQTHWDQGVSG